VNKSKENNFNTKLEEPNHGERQRKTEVRGNVQTCTDRGMSIMQTQLYQTPSVRKTLHHSHLDEGQITDEAAREVERSPLRDDGVQGVMVHGSNA
jgi:hypothetical protein